MRCISSSACSLVACGFKTMIIRASGPGSPTKEPTALAVGSVRSRESRRARLGAHRPTAGGTAPRPPGLPGRTSHVRPNYLDGEVLRQAAGSVARDERPGEWESGPSRDEAPVSARSPLEAVQELEQRALERLPQSSES